MSEDQRYLLAACTDEQGEMMETCSINIEIPNRYTLFFLHVQYRSRWKEIEMHLKEKSKALCIKKKKMFFQEQTKKGFCQKNWAAETLGLFAWSSVHVLCTM